MSNYIKLLDGSKSNAGGFEYKIGKVNVADNWNPTTSDPKLMGGFNFSTDEKILRWIHRGDTVYDVIIPEDAEGGKDLRRLERILLLASRQRPGGRV